MEEGSKPKPSGLERLTAKYEKKKAKYESAAAKKASSGAKATESKTAKTAEKTAKKEKHSAYKKEISTWKSSKPVNPNKKAKAAPGVKPDRETRRNERWTGKSNRLAAKAAEAGSVGKTKKAARYTKRAEGALKKVTVHAASA